MDWMRPAQFCAQIKDSCLGGGEPMSSTSKVYIASYCKSILHITQRLGAQVMDGLQ